MSAKKVVFIDHLSLHHIDLFVRGELDGPSAREIRHLVDSLLLPETRHVGINFRRCEEFRGMGLRVLLDFISEMEDRGLSLELSGIAKDRFGPLRDALEGNTHEVRHEGSELYSIFMMKRNNCEVPVEGILRRRCKGNG
ncbi:MAG: hypothetical protein IH975_04895 [Nitrospinae bacterium]|nr:hypothetical protein [Nitrospinota bacterium]